MRKRDINRSFQDPTASAAFVSEPGYNFSDIVRTAELLHFAEVYETRRQRRAVRRQAVRMPRRELMEGGVYNGRSSK